MHIRGTIAHLDVHQQTVFAIRSTKGPSYIEQSFKINKDIVLIHIKCALQVELILKLHAALVY